MIHIIGMYTNSGQFKRITLNLPQDLLRDAQGCTGKNMTETIIDALKLLKRSRAYSLGMKLKGQIDLQIDLDQSRERRR